MPHPTERVGALWSSKNELLEFNQPPQSSPQGPQFTESPQDPRGQPGFAKEREGLDLEATDPFPPGLFRVPIPNKVFGQMPSLSDAALRVLLGLVRLSFHFDPEASTWTRPEKWLTRADIEEASGLSDEGTRKGLSELEDRGWIETDRSGRAHRHRLLVEVPSRRYTYVPTTLLKEARGLRSTTQLRVILTVLRRTWGWTEKEAARTERFQGERSQGRPEGGRPEGERTASGELRTVHRRWTQLSNGCLSQLTGRSETAVKNAISALEGEWIERFRPGGEAYRYRLLPGPLSPEGGGEPPTDPPSGDFPEGSLSEDFPLDDSPSENLPLEEDGPEKENPEKENPENGSFEGGPSSPTANGLPPDRQRGAPPSSNKESSPKDKQPTQESISQGEAQKSGDNQSEGNSAVLERAKNNDSGAEFPFEDFGPRKSELGRKLINVGVWPDRARECLERYAAPRIEANFRLYRERAPEVENGGAWLCAAITDGYADIRIGEKTEPTAGGEQPEEDPSSSRPEHKQKISPKGKASLVAQFQEIEDGHFHRFRQGESPTEKQFLYFDPDVGGPNRRAGHQGPARAQGSEP